MTITMNNGQFEFTRTGDGIIGLLAPVYRYENGEEITLSPAGEGVFADENNRVTYTAEKKTDRLFYLHRTWTNTASHAVKIQTSFRVKTGFVPERYLIPCVSANGNEFGKGGEPKGLIRDGKKWIFGYDRTSLPACTLTENADFACAVFASGESEVSMQSSCSLTKNEDGTFTQEILHPVIESPVTYVNRDKYGPAYETWIELAPGESFDAGFCICVSRPRWANYGAADLCDEALAMLGDNSDLIVPADDVIWDRSITFAKSLITDYKGNRGFIIGFLPDGKGGFAYRGDRCFELAWCGQNILFSRMLIEDYAQRGNRESLDTALEILDTRVKLCTADNGLLAAQLRDFENLNGASADTCNMGYGAYEYLRCYVRLRELGIDKPAYLSAGRGLCDFFCENWSDEYGFGKQWRLDGTLIDGGGTIGGFVICAFAKLYEITKEEKYLAMADRALRFYMERDVDRFICTAGALDTTCVDKETSTPFIISGILLYQLTGEKYYLTCAEKAAYYFTSWMYHYDPVYAPDSDKVKYGVCFKGLTSVSAQHHHLDPYGGLVVPYLYKLAELTGDMRWKTRGEMMERAVMQLIGDGKLKIHDLLRPVGSQNEAYFHCRWGFEDREKGVINDWLVAWPCAFRMSILSQRMHPDF